MVRAFNKIGWCHFTFNLWEGCFKISPGCKHCYAAEMNNWLHKGEHWERTGPRRFFGDDHWKKPLAWNRAAARSGVRYRVFCGSIMDWAEIHPDRAINARLDMLRHKMWSLIAATEHLDWLLLTKRIENVPDFLPRLSFNRPDYPQRVTTWHERFREPWSVRPWRNVWLGTSVEEDLYARTRLPILQQIPAVVTFGSYEPAIGSIDWPTIPWMPDWMIFGDESGRKRRPAELEWARQTRDACAARGKSFYFKQWNGDETVLDGIAGIRVKGKIHLPVLDGSQHAEFPEARDAS